MQKSTEAVELYDLLKGYQVTQAISTAARLKLADMLKDGPKSCEAIASITGLCQKKLYRLLRALASIGIFEERQEQIFALTPKADLLISDAENTLYHYAVRSGRESYMAWSKLLEGLHSDVTPFTEHYQDSFFSYLTKHPDLSKQFNAAMAEHTQKDIPSILDGYDFSKVDSIVDIGGGTGQLLKAILAKHPDIHGTLFDLKGIIDEAKDNSIKKDTPYMFVKGDFLQAIQVKANLYILKHILHDWNDDKAVIILKNIRKTIPENGRLLIIDTLIPDGNEPDASKWQDLHMLTLFNGKERSKKQMLALIEEAGFKLSFIKSLPRTGLTALSLIEAQPA
ncbi:MAG: hypothetical protein K0R66_1157 [Gammaproteobacteria bacterium]|nr:hypothetical protein [Gammaproteobacteria bacterium]